MTKARQVDSFFKTLGGQSITFDDVSLVPSYADFLPKDADREQRVVVFSSSIPPDASA